MARGTFTGSAKKAGSGDPDQLADAVVPHLRLPVHVGPGAIGMNGRARYKAQAIDRIEHFRCILLMHNSRHDLGLWPRPQGCPRRSSLCGSCG
jgi:hypothetical protein